MCETVGPAGLEGPPSPGPRGPCARLYSWRPESRAHAVRSLCRRPPRRPAGVGYPIDSSVTSSHCHRSGSAAPAAAPAAPSAALRIWPRVKCVLNARSGSRGWGLATAELGAGWPWMLMPQEQVAPGNGPSFHVDLPGGGRPPAGSPSHSAAGPWRLRGGIRGFRASSGVAFRMSRIRQRSPLSDSETFPPPRREAPSPPPLQAPARPLPVSVDAPVWAFHIDGLTPCSPCLACLSLGPAMLR